VGNPIRRIPVLTKIDIKSVEHQFQNMDKEQKNLQEQKKKITIFMVIGKEPKEAQSSLSEQAIHSFWSSGSATNESN
jgi:hypothetical protein